MRSILIILLSCFTFLVSNGQELNCMVSINSNKIAGTDKRAFDALQNAMYEFVNNRKWSNYNIRTEEKIECTMRLTVDDRLSSDEYKCSMNIVVRRPVYSSSYNTTLLNAVDKYVNIRYVENQPLDYSDGTFTSNLTSIMAYYCYMVLGYYFDSYSLNGGSPFFEKAQEIVNTAQSSSELGWKAFDSDKNRFWMVGNLVNPANSGIRDFNYKYHRLGLDAMYEKVDQGRTGTSDALEQLKQVYNSKPNLYALQLIFDAKRDEFVNIYSDERVAPMEKTNIVNILKEIDPANSSKYAAILSSN